MFTIDIYSRTPVYEQIIKQAEDFVSAGLLKAGDKIPSVRNLSLHLSVNPNTIQKSYSELDARGIIFSVPGKGCFITKDALETVNKAKQKKLSELKYLIAELKCAGTPKKTITDTVDEIYNKKGDKA